MGRATSKKKKQAQTSPTDLAAEGRGGWWILWAALVALISILVMLTWTITLYSRSGGDLRRQPLSRVSNNSSWKVTGEVSVKVLSSPDAAFAKTCTKNAVPVLLKNTIVTRWQAQKWSPAYLKTKLKNLRGVYDNSNRWFGPYFMRSKPLLEQAVRKNPYRTDVELTAEEFFHRLDSPKQGRYHYFSGDIDNLGDWAYSEVQPVQELLLPNPRRSSVNAWIGQPHVVAHCHYDGYHNFYAQLYGIKKFTLFRPTNWPGLYPYPFLHPSHAQAQVNASCQEDVGEFGLVRVVEAVEVTLGPGDLLYIPPLWFHEVESLSISISVNVWTDSHQTELMEKVFSLPLPLNDGSEGRTGGGGGGRPHGHEHARWRDQKERRIAAAILVFRLLEHVCRHHSCRDVSTDKFFNQSSEVRPKDTPSYFVHQLWSTRYRPLLEKGQLPSEFQSGSILCEGEDTDTRTAISASEAILRDVHYGAYLEQVAQLVRGLPADTWELWLGNYVEYVAASVLDEVKYVGLFLKHFASCTNHIAL